MESQMGSATLYGKRSSSRSIGGFEFFTCSEATQVNGR